MQIVILVLGLVVGYFVSRRALDFTLILVFLYKYRRKSAFLDLYDLLDDEHGYKLLKTHSKATDSYSKYLRLHQKARPEAYALFSAYYQDVTKYVFAYAALIAVLSLAFWTRGMYFFVGVLIVLVVGVAYKRIVKRQSVDFYGRLMINSILTDFEKTKT